MKKYKFKGELLSIKQIAESLQVTYSFICQKLRGIKEMTDVTNALLKREHNLYLYNNKLLSISAIARIKRISRDTIAYKLRCNNIQKNTDVTKLIDDINSRYNKYYIYFGQRMTVVEIKNTGIKHSFLYRYLKDVEIGSDVSFLKESFENRHIKKKLPQGNFEKLKKNSGVGSADKTASLLLRMAGIYHAYN
jgi:hypothetical protein